MLNLLLKIIGWIFVPFIMLPFQWKKMGKLKRYLGTAWSLLFIIAALADGGNPQTTNQASTSSSSSSTPSITVSSPAITATNTESEKTTAAQNKEEAAASNTSSNNSSTDKKTTASTTVTESKDKNYDVVLYFPVSKYPETAAHIESAISKGESAICTIDRDGAEENRKESLEGIATKSGYDRDEWPMAMCAEGGSGADIAYIDPSDNRGAGSWVGNQLESYSDGTRVLFVIDGNADGKVLSATKPSSTNSSSSTKSSSSSSSASSEKKTESSTSNVVSYKNCSAVKAAGKAPLYKGDPGYSKKLDRDGDGVACEK